MFTDICFIYRDVVCLIIIFDFFFCLLGADGLNIEPADSAPAPVSTEKRANIFTLTLGVTPYFYISSSSSSFPAVFFSLPLLDKSPADAQSNSYL